uniref:Putative secreted protein n=1 Tax=Anopheles marajoara TaxID=58244 RepID=A0A2M4CAP3_9DIPT
MLIVLCLYLLGSLSGVLRGTHGAASPRRCKIPDSDPSPNGGRPRKKESFVFVSVWKIHPGPTFPRSDPGFPLLLFNLFSEYRLM